MNYPANWPKCPYCLRPVLDGHETCGSSVCKEEAARRWRSYDPRCGICGVPLRAGNVQCDDCTRRYLSDCCGGMSQGGES